MSSIQAKAALGLGQDQEEEEEDQFNSLSDDIVFQIFTILQDAKWLCRCFLVCKRFASLIPTLHTVSVSSTSWISLSFPFPPNYNSNEKSEKQPEEEEKSLSFLGKLFKSSIGIFVTKPLRFIHRIFVRPTLESNFPVLNFLNKLKQIRSLHVELPSSDFGCTESFKWGAKFSTHLDSLTFLYATSLREINEEFEEESEEEEEAEEEVNGRLRLGVRCLEDAAMRQAVLLHVVQELPLLQDVVFTDFDNKGVKLRLGTSKIADIKNSINYRRMLNRFQEVMKQKKVRVGYVPVLYLPKSGFVMKGVMVVTIKLFADDDYDEDGAMLAAFEEEEDAFLEAVVQILANHRDNIKTYFWR